MRRRGRDISAAFGVCYVSISHSVSPSEFTQMNPVFGLGVFSMARRHALVSLRHALVSLRLMGFNFQWINHM